MRIRPDHPLSRLFAELVDRHLVQFGGLEDPEMARYIAALLVDFTHADAVWRIRNTKGRRLEEVGDMLIESSRAFEERSFIREREMRKHIGDYTLFITGLFPEHLARLRHRADRIDSLVDYMRTGKESYRAVAAFDSGDFAAAAPLFRRLSDRFELCAFGLNLVKQHLEYNQRAWYRSVLGSLDTA